MSMNVLPGRVSASISMLAAVILTLSAASADSDEILQKEIVGLWYSDHEWVDRTNPANWMKAHGEDHYHDDGVVEGFNRYRYPNKEAEFRYKGTWEVKEGYLIIEVTEASGGYVKIGTTTRDKIVRLSESSLELQAEDGNIVVFRRR